MRRQDDRGCGAFECAHANLRDHVEAVGVNQHRPARRNALGDEPFHQRSRIGAAQRLRDLSGAVVLLKGARTVIAGIDGEVYINASGNPGMATPGMGDVLSGIVGALLARRLAPLDALALGAFVHGHAADRLAARMGPVGYLAGDLADELPSTLAALG